MSWKRLALSLALLVPASPAWALGIGTTLGVGGGFPLSININGEVVRLGGTSSGFLPSLDFHFSDVALQVHVLETLAGLATEDFFFGANIYFGLPMGGVGGGWDALVAPGAGLDLFIDPFAMGITAEAQFGVTREGAASLGLAIVPALGVWIVDGDVDLLVGGTLQMSIWFGAGGGGGGGGTGSGSGGGTGSGGGDAGGGDTGDGG